MARVLPGISDLGFKLGGMLHPYTPLGTKFLDVLVRHDDTRNFRSHYRSRNARSATFLDTSPLYAFRLLRRICESMKNDSDSSPVGCDLTVVCRLPRAVVQRLLSKGKG